MATAAVMNSSSPITQVTQQQPVAAIQPQLLTRLHLELRGRRFSVDRETIMNLPESVLLCLFPNGLVLSRQSAITGGGGSNANSDVEMGEDEEMYAVDFDPDCFAYVLEVFRKASEEFYGTDEKPGLLQAQAHLANEPNPVAGPLGGEFGGGQNPLFTKQAIIVLREELEYFAIPPASMKEELADVNGAPSPAMNTMKRLCGDKLLEKITIFTALQRNINKENNLAEQHLIDMLCMSGFERDDEWGYRAIEPARCLISSIALVHLKTGITHPTNGDPVTVDYPQMGTAQKLLLFWRKPARKCWWDGSEVEIASGSAEEPMRKVKLWARRVWTLELSLVSVQDDEYPRLVIHADVHSSSS